MRKSNDADIGTASEQFAGLHGAHETRNDEGNLTMMEFETTKERVQEKGTTRNRGNSRYVPTNDEHFEVNRGALH